MPFFLTFILSVWSVCDHKYLWSRNDRLLNVNCGYAWEIYSFGEAYACFPELLCTVLLPESFRGGCSFGAIKVTVLFDLNDRLFRYIFPNTSWAYHNQCGCINELVWHEEKWNFSTFVNSFNSFCTNIFLLGKNIIWFNHRIIPSSGCCFIFYSSGEQDFGQ